MTTSEDASIGDAKPEPLPLPDFTNTVDWHASPDTNLQQMADWANRVGIGAAVTLYLPWGIASGHVVPGKAFFEHAARTVRASAEEDEDDKRVKLVDLYANFFLDSAAESYDRADDKEEMHQGHFTARSIHLQDVQCFVPGMPGRVTHDYLRVHLSHITAWAIGAYSRRTDD